MTDDLTYDKIETRMRKAILAMETATQQHADDLKELARVCLLYTSDAADE